MNRPMEIVHCLLACASSFIVASAVAAHGVPSDRLALLDERIEAAPDSAQLYLRRAALYRELGDRSAAMRDVERAAAIEPALPGVSRLRGFILLDEGRPEAASTSLTRYLDAVPNDASARAARANAWTTLGRPLDAAREFTRVIEQRPAPVPDDYLARARALVAAPEPRLEEALRGLDEAQAALGPVTSLALYAVEIELARGNPDAALTRLETAAAGWPRRDTYWMLRGSLLERLGRVHAARDAFTRALVALSALPAPVRATPASLGQRARAMEALERLAMREVAATSKESE